MSAEELLAIPQHEGGRVVLLDIPSAAALKVGEDGCSFVVGFEEERGLVQVVLTQKVCAHREPSITSRNSPTPSFSKMQDPLFTTSSAQD